jgi:hypothetical protein
MRRIAYPYYLLALMATSVAVFFVMKKIDKHGFYHHYFRVIEDVESRNSQAVETLPALLAEVNALQVDVRTLFYWLLGLLSAGAAASLRVVSLFPRDFASVTTAPLLRWQFWSSMPVRAP